MVTMNRRRIVAVIILAAVLVAAWQGRALLSKGAESAKGGHQRPAPVVQTGTAAVKPVPLLLHAVGQAESEHSVAVRAQIKGILDTVAFEEGADIKAGQLLFRIDPAPFQASVDQAQAAVARDKASLANASWQAQRLAPLAKLEYVTPQEYETAKTSVAQAKAALEADQAALKQARIQLGYTRISSPIAGRAGAVSVKPGNLVDAGAATPLVTINQIAPILVRFTVSQEQFEQVRRYRAKGPIRVLLSGPKGAAAAGAGEGILVFVDNTVDPTTGTVALKARFPNTGKALWPGEYTAVDLELTVEQHAVVVPDTAVQPGQSGAFVYVVEDGVAHVRPVEVARELDGQAVIGQGLKGGETIIVRVPRNLRDGLAVKPRPDSGATTQAADKQ